MTGLDDAGREELRRLAEVALEGGAWSHDREDGQVCTSDGELVSAPTTIARADFIGAASPDVVLAMLDEVERLRGAVTEARRLRDDRDAFDQDRGNNYRERDMAFGAVDALDQILALTDAETPDQPGTPAEAAGASEGAQTGAEGITEADVARAAERARVAAEKRIERGGPR